MKRIVGLNLIVMFILFNFGLYIVDMSGLYTVNVGQSMATTLPFGVNIVVTLVGTILAAATGGLVGGYFGLDPLKVGGLTALSTNILFIWSRSTYGVVNTLTKSLTGNNNVAMAVASGFLLFTALLIAIFVIQLTTGGWLNVK